MPDLRRNIKGKDVTCEVVAKPWDKECESEEGV